mmetsp:Transcript_90639/g.170859  ORF Transcript_90639/g.170859 Transcript_90639/m.170859 type:complete len:208 (+) Transcript_90639:792-1415(+)
MRSQRNNDRKCFENRKWLVIRERHLHSCDQQATHGGDDQDVEERPGEGPLLQALLQEGARTHKKPPVEDEPQQYRHIAHGHCESQRPKDGIPCVLQKGILPRHEVRDRGVYFLQSRHIGEVSDEPHQGNEQEKDDKQPKITNEFLKSPRSWADNQVRVYDICRIWRSRDGKRVSILCVVQRHGCGSILHAVEGDEATERANFFTVSP